LGQFAQRNREYDSLSIHSSSFFCADLSLYRLRRLEFGRYVPICSSLRYRSLILRFSQSRSRPGAGSNDPDSPSWDVPTLASASRASSPLVQPEVGRLRRRMTQMTTLPSRIHRRATTLRRRPSPNPPRSTSPTARIGRIGGEDRHGNAVYDDSPFAVGDRKGKRAMIKKFFRPHGSE